MEVPVDTRVWLERPPTEVPAWQGRERKPTRERLKPEAPAAQAVAEVKTGPPLLLDNIKRTTCSVA